MPVGKALVRLVLTEPAVQGATNGADRLTADSGTDGHFAFERVLPGAYTIRVERSGFVAQYYGGEPGSVKSEKISVAPGQTVSSLIVRLTPASSISGKVEDQDGDPVVNAAVTVLKRSYIHGQRFFVPAGHATTKDDGSYAILALPPGRYYLFSNGRLPIEAPGLPEPASSGVPGEGFTDTYYPSSSDADAAAPLDVPAGVAMTGIQIRLRTAPSFRISGRVVDGATGSPIETTLTLAAADHRDVLVSPLMVQALGGKFGFSRVPRGTYTLQALNAAQLVGRYELNIRDHDIEDLVVELGPGTTVTGRVTVDPADLPQGLPALGTPGAGPASGEPSNAARVGVSGLKAGDDPTASQLSRSSAGARTDPGDQRSAPTPSLRVKITLDDASYGAVGIGHDPKGGWSGANGVLALSGVTPDRYFVNVSGLGPSEYVESIRSGSADATNSAVEVGGSVASIEVTLGMNAPDVSGSVTRGSGEPAAGTLVLLWAAQGGATAIARSIRTVAVSRDGQYRIGNLSPGDYNLLAFDWPDPDVIMNQTLFSALAGQATRITLQKGDHASVQPKLINPEDIRLEVSKLR
jgi:hypothetical protein